MSKTKLLFLMNNGVIIHLTMGNATQNYLISVQCRYIKTKYTDFSFGEISIYSYVATHFPKSNLYRIEQLVPMNE